MTEEIRQELIAATYRLAQEIFRDPKVMADYERWAERRNNAKSVSG